MRFTSVQGDYSLEQKVQRKLSEFHIVGEFFACSFDFACLMLGKCCGAPITPEQIFFPDINMSPKGRPTDNPKQERITVRLDEQSSKILQKYCEQENVEKAEAIRRGVKKLADEIK